MTSHSSSTVLAEQGMILMTIDLKPDFPDTPQGLADAVGTCLHLQEKPVRQTPRRNRDPGPGRGPRRLMAGETVRAIGQIEAPYGREILLQGLVLESGLRTMRIRIREGSRFTILDIDPAPAAQWSALMEGWAAPE